MTAKPRTDALEMLAALRKKHRLPAEPRESPEMATLSAIGLAPHRSHGPITLGMASECFASIKKQLSTYAWLYLGQLAILDGWMLARHLVKPPRAKARVLATPAAATRFEKRVAAAGGALLAGPLAREASELVASYAGRLRAGERAVGRAGFANGVAAGILLYGFEYDLDDTPLFAHLVPAKKPPVRRGPEHVTYVEPPDELLAAVLAAPLDDAPRVVLGDWLAERGEPLGELIQLQCALAGEPHDADELRAREAALRKAHEKRWLEPIRASIRQWTFARGFVNGIVADIGRFIDAHDAFARIPLLVAQLTGYKPALLGKVRAARPLATLRAVHLSSNALTPQTLEVLASPLFERITALDLAANRFGDDGIPSLVAALPPNVTRLGLAGTKITAAGVETLARSKRIGSLTHLDLHWNQHAGDDAVDAINRAANLEWLALSSNDLTAEGLARLALPRLTELLLAGRPIEGIERLLDNPRLRALKKVRAPEDTPTSVLSRLDARFGATNHWNVFAY